MLTNRNPRLKIIKLLQYRKQWSNNFFLVQWWTKIIISLFFSHWQLSLEQLDANTKRLEDNLIEMLLAERELLSNDNSTDLSMEFMIAKSFPDTINKKITSNIPKVAGSFLIMFIYVCVSLGNMSCVENRVSSQTILISNCIQWLTLNWITLNRKCRLF